MTAPREVETCPQCRDEGYAYDPVCRVWCCGRCYATETVEEKMARGSRLTAAASIGEGTLSARTAGEKRDERQVLPLMARRVS